MGQLSALFYKNWLLYKRSLLGNILEILVPIFFILFIVMVRRLEQPTVYAEQSFIGNGIYSRAIDSATSSTDWLKYDFGNLDIVKREKWWDWHQGQMV